MAAPTLELDPKYDHYDYPTTSPNKQSGHPGHTTAQENAKVYQLRTELERAGCKDRLDTHTMLRFLRARKFDVQASKKMFLDCEQWRKQFGGGVEHLVRTFDYKEKPQVFKYYPQYYHNTDKDGRPVYIEQLGNIDLNAMYKITTAERTLQNLVCEYEKVADPRLPACSRKAGQLLETCCTIMDLKGVGLGSARQVYDYIGKASAISQNYYPERLGKLYVVHAPWGFSTVWSFVKGFLDPVTVSKIHVLGSGYEKELHAQIPKENLPKRFGGTCECPGGCEFADPGPWRDSQYTKPAWWERPADAIENKGTDIEGADAKDASVGEHGLSSAGKAGAEADAKAPAHA